MPKIRIKNCETGEWEDFEYDAEPEKVEPLMVITNWESQKVAKNPICPDCDFKYETSDFFDKLLSDAPREMRVIDYQDGDRTFMCERCDSVFYEVDPTKKKLVKFPKSE